MSLLLATVLILLCLCLISSIVTEYYKYDFNNIYWLAYYTQFVTGIASIVLIVTWLVFTVLKDEYTRNSLPF